MQARRLRRTTVLDLAKAGEVRRLLAAAQRNPSARAVLNIFHERASTEPGAAPVGTLRFQWRGTARDFGGRRPTATSA